MINIATVLTLDSEKIVFLLTNHKFFSSAEIKLAAKIKVINDKKAEYAAFVTLECNRREWAARAADTRAAVSYNHGFNEGVLNNFLGFDGFGSRF